MITLDTPAAEVLEIAKQCEGCGHCCSYGSGFLVQDDLDPMARFLNVSVDQLKAEYLEPVTKFNTTLLRPKLRKKEGMPYGPCIFLDKDKRCSVHAVKPLQCKMYSRPSGKGEELNVYFMLTHFLREEDQRSQEEYMQYVSLGGKTLPGMKTDRVHTNTEAR